MMINATRIGRFIGVLMLLQFVGGVLVNFVLLEPVFAAPGFLTNAASHSFQVALSVLLGLATSTLMIGIAIASFPVFRQYSHPLALWFVALAVIIVCMSAVEYINLMSMLSLSQAYVRTTSPDHMLFEALRVTVASTRNWAHYMGLIMGGCALLLFYSALFRLALIPRPLAAFGLVAVALQITTVAMPLFGHAVLFWLLLPLALCQLTVALWLITKGMPNRPRSHS